MSCTQGIRQNWSQFALQLVTVFAVGLTIGAERNVVPVLGRDVLGVESMLVIGSFVVSFGFVKALLNLYGGKWSESYGRKPILIAGWLVALPIPVILIYAPNWWWISIGNVLLGINQGLAWSMSVNAKIDLAGSEARSFAVGLDEAFGYGGVAVGTWVTGVIAAQYGLRPTPFYFLAGVIIIAFIVSIFLVEETLPYAESEAESKADDAAAELSFRSILKRVTWGDKTLFAASQAGSVEKFVDALVWIAYPLYLTTAGLTIGEVGIVVGVYGGVWGIFQLYTGKLADDVGRRSPVIIGMFVAGIGVLSTVLVEGYWFWLLTAGVTGVGMALLYPNLITVVGDAAHPSWRATSLGVYRMWRDAGYGFGAILIGVTADFVSIQAAFYGVAAAMFVSGGIAFAWMQETHPERSVRRIKTQTTSSIGEDQKP
ncbi:Predicted arabinose efflux permease, MFS family [Haladaptatus litoreus]|uniref:Predicted arabinose efflux permease, MFS family n=1 Tax=Haladaptatus litoreus TaxID=553468 RepID=A0A1N7ETW5_9EURY|nr:MFS transporter [Haladaptatus litoreus]SIR91530.1 Predicted arabinose efflux permease, MFS family [Haladaptatus litoreus]